jgi:hypothetical protein
MNWRCLISVLASSILFGCAGDSLVSKDTKRSLALNWDRAEWRFCESAECATPTPKTVLLVSSPPVVEPVALTSEKAGTGSQEESNDICAIQVCQCVGHG